MDCGLRIEKHADFCPASCFPIGNLKSLFMPASSASYVSPLVATRREFSARRAWAAWVCALVLTLVWVGLILGAPAAAAGGHETLAFVLYHGLGSVCHQIPERAFWLAGHPLGVCARCFGIYAGFSVAVVLYPLARSLRRTGTPRREWLIVALLPTAFDFMLGITGLWANTHLSRSLTGAWLGAWVAFYVVPGAIELAQHRRRQQQQQTRAALVAFEQK